MLTDAGEADTVGSELQERAFLSCFRVCPGHESKPWLWCSRHSPGRKDGDSDGGRADRPTGSAVDLAHGTRRLPRAVRDQAGPEPPARSLTCAPFPSRGPRSRQLQICFSSSSRVLGPPSRACHWSVSRPICARGGGRRGGRGEPELPRPGLRRSPPLPGRSGL